MKTKNKNKMRKETIEIRKKYIILMWEEERDKISMTDMQSIWRMSLGRVHAILKEDYLEVKLEGSRDGKHFHKLERSG